MAASIDIAAADDVFVYDNGPIGNPDGAPADIPGLLHNGYDMVVAVLVDNREAFLYLAKLGLVFAFGYALFTLYRRRGDGD